jgi:hypothetical protein
VLAAAVCEAAAGEREPHKVLEILFVRREADEMLAAALGGLHGHAAEELPLVEGIRGGVLDLDAHGGLLRTCEVEP